MLRNLRKNKKVRLLITLICVVFAAFMQAYVIKVFIQPADLLSSGFTGVAILIEKNYFKIFWFFVFYIIRYDITQCPSCYIML